MKDLKTPWELFGVECGEGWFSLIEPILQYIQSYNKDKAEEYQIVVYQIKEKWGILQLEIGNYPNELAKMIEAAEKRPQPLARNAVLQVLYGSSVVGIKHYAMIVGKKK